MDIKFDYNEYWVDTTEEPEYVEESSDVTDQDFWELHKFVLESEINIYDSIYSESVGSAVKNTIGAVIDKILEAFIRIAEAFKKQSMKKAVKWLKKNEENIKKLATDDEEVHKALQAINFGQICLSTYAEEFEKWAKKPGDISLVLYECSRILGNVYKSAHEEKERIFNLRRLKVDGAYRPGYDDWKKWDDASISELMNSVILSMDLKGYDRWYKYAQDLRVRIKKAKRQGQLRDEENGIDRVFLILIPKEMMEAFQGITSGIKRLKKKVDENANKLKAKKPIIAPTTESYYDLFESEHIEESYEEPTDQDFWELHSFVLECELDIYGGIYSESVGSIVKASFGIILDKIAETFLRICEAFRKKSMKRAVMWLKDNVTIINEKCKGDEEVTGALIRILNGHKLISEYAEALEKWADTPNEDGTTDEKLANELAQISKSVQEQVAKRTPVKVSTLANKIANSLESGGYDVWYGIARDLRTYARRKHRIAQAHETTNATAQMCLEIPKQMMDAFNDITEGIKTVKSRVSAITKAEAKAKKQTPKPATESYYVEFEPEVDIIF